MMLGKRKQTTAPWKKRYTEKVAKEKKDHNSDQGIIQGSIS